MMWREATSRLERVIRLLDPRKAAVIGCGFVGASIAFSLMQKDLFSELVLIDTDRPKAEGEAMDLSHGLPYTASMDIYAGDYPDLVNGMDFTGGNDLAVESDFAVNIADQADCRKNRRQR